MDENKNLHAGHRERMKERFEKYGFTEDTPQHEILELMLYYSLPRKNTNGLAHDLINKYKTLFAVLSAPTEELMQIKGISRHSALLLKLFFETAKLYIEPSKKKHPALHNSDEAGDYLLRHYQFYGNEEVFSMIAINNLGKIDSFHVLEKGDIASVGVSTRKILEILIKTKATAVIIAHNHPGGIALPSDADIQITAAIKSALATIGVHLSDHIIIADDDFVSLAQSEKFKSLFK